MEELILRYKHLLSILMDCRPLPFNELVPSKLPKRGGVYRIYETNSIQSISTYVGKSKNLQERIYRNHLMGNLEASNLKKKFVSNGICLDAAGAKLILQSQHQVQYVVIDNPFERTYFEHFAVAIIQPKYND